jgi:two-component system phosphate regulon sensor histidine kinase PhoR
VSQAELDTRDWSAFRGQYEAWNTYALAPDAIAALALVDREGGTEVWDGSRFTQATGADPASLAARELGEAARGLGEGETPPLFLLKVGEAHDAILVAAGAADSGRRLAVIMDRRVVADRLIPLLAERHLYGKAEYRFRVIDRGDAERVVYESDPKSPRGAFDRPDFEVALVVELPTLLDRGFIGLIRRENGNEGGREDYLRTPFARILQARRIAFSNREGAEPPAAAGLAQARGGEPPQPGQGFPVMAPATGIILQAVHREGSLAAAVGATKRRNTILGLGVLGVLGAGIALLSLSAARARLLAERQREFIAAVSHELKTPLAVLRSASENLADGLIQGEERVRGYGEALKQESSRLGDLIDRLLRFARLSAGRREGPLPTFDLRDLVREIAAAYGPEFHAARFRLELAPGEEAAWISADRAALGVALRNLVENVLRHAADGRYIGLRVMVQAQDRCFPFRLRGARPGLPGQPARPGRTARTRVILRVSDRGPGIPRRERRSVFEAFTRGERARRLQIPGSGIGLGLAAKIIEADGGRIRLESKVDYGSDFEISYPLAPPPTDPAAGGEA